MKSSPKVRIRDYTRVTALTFALVACLYSGISQGLETPNSLSPAFERQGTISKVSEITYSDRAFPNSRAVFFQLSEDPGVRYETTILRGRELGLIKELDKFEYAGQRAFHYTTNEKANGWRVRITANPTKDSRVYRLESFEKIEKFTIALQRVKWTIQAGAIVGGDPEWPSASCWILPENANYEKRVEPIEGPPDKKVPSLIVINQDNRLLSYFELPKTAENVRLVQEKDSNVRISYRNLTPLCVEVWLGSSKGDVPVLLELREVKPREK